MIIWYGDTSFTCAKAWKMLHEVIMFDENDEIIRIISARKATKYEQNVYEENL